MPTAIKNFRSIKTIKQPRFNRTNLYDTQRWRKESKRFLRANPLCRECLKEGDILRSEGARQMLGDTDIVGHRLSYVVAAEVVDHIAPHNGNAELFWDKTNWQGLCIPHHNAKSTREKNEKVYI